jgi:membrane protease YdiL (CAAX protease family)
MKSLAASLAWLFGFVLIGAAAMLAFAFGGLHHPGLARPALKLIGLGAEFGLNLFALAFCFALLPGTRRRPAAPAKFGLGQGIWAMLGFGLVMAGGGLLFVNILAVEDFILALHHSLARVDFSGHAFLLGSALAGEAAAALWVSWYLRRQGQQRLTDGGTTGIAWRAASPAAYPAAALCALAIVALVMLLYHFVPPDFQKLQNLPMEKLFSGSGLSLLPLILVVVLIGPVLEEFVFRGIAFAGLATRLGPLWAGFITTLAFMAAHAPEKIHYLPGFLDVGLVGATAAYLRVKYRSIRPGILLHILYNAGSALAASLLG